MFDFLPIPLPCWVGGPLMGLTVAGFYAVTNKDLGIGGAYVQVVDHARGLPIETWRLWFLVGTLVGAAIVAVLGGSPQAGWGYGVLGEYLSIPALVLAILVGGALIVAGIALCDKVQRGQRIVSSLIVAHIPRRTPGGPLER